MNITPSIPAVAHSYIFARGRILTNGTAAACS